MTLENSLTLFLESLVFGTYGAINLEKNDCAKFPLTRFMHENFFVPRELLSVAAAETICVACK